MSLRIGIIGAGVMGADHAAIIAERVSGAELVAISDPDRARAETVASRTGARQILDDPGRLIGSPDVNAVLIASPDGTHAELVLACLRAGKPVLCEKPLAPTAEECLRIVGEEAAHGRQLVQVGFMRRFDPGYVAMKRTLADGALGQPLFLHCVHRNAAAPPWFTSEMLISNSAVHEIDIARFLLDKEFVGATVFGTRPLGPDGLRDPQFLVLEAEGGVLVDVELFMNARYGYDIRAELVCEAGAVSLAPPVEVFVRHDGAERFGFASDWRPRFAAAYRNQLQAWVDSIGEGTAVGASAWDGYVATAVAEACLGALAGGTPVEVSLPKRPDFYA